jgi:membrane-associated phospholipid phosphatase
MDMQERATWPRRGLHLLVNMIAFALCYPLANLLAQRNGVTAELVLEFERALPFLAWTAIPYMTSALFWILSFSLVRTDDGLRMLSQRMLLATAVATLFFVLYPLTFSWQRPPIDSAFLSFLFTLQMLVDLPYNQFPSLHVAFAVIHWQALRDVPRSRFVRGALAAWLILLVCSTVLTYQHHVLDIAGGLVLGIVCCSFVRPARAEPDVGFYYRIAAVVTWISGVLFAGSLWFLYLSLSLLLVSQAYVRNNRHFLGKHKGSFGLFTWLKYAPYLLLYRLSWLWVRWQERAHPAFVRMTPKLWVGRRLTAIEAAQLPPDCVVIDLANELSETPLLRSHDYHHFSLLDLQSPPADVVEEIVATMLREAGLGHSIYLHCAMGYSRSKIIAKIYMTRAPDDTFDLPAQTEVPATA